MVDDLHHHLGGPGRLDGGGAGRLGARAVDEGAHDLERDVRLEQRAPDLAHRGVDVLLRQRAAAGQLVQYAGELFRKALEHDFLLWASSEWRRGVASPLIYSLFATSPFAHEARPIEPGGETRVRPGPAA